jgi:hypothetical protein
VATLLLTQRSDSSYVRPHQSLVGERIWGWLHSWRLDHALARGEAPDSSAALFLRAHRLIGPKFRRALAAEIRALPAAALRARHPFDPRVPVRRQQVLESLELLEKLADRLEAPEPVDARGVAQVRVLLRDGESPLFDPDRGVEFAEAFEAALEALEPVAAFDWLG